MQSGGKDSEEVGVCNDVGGSTGKVAELRIERPRNKIGRDERSGSPISNDCAGNRGRGPPKQSEIDIISRVWCPRR